MSGIASCDPNGNFHFDFILKNNVHKYFYGKFSSALPAWSGKEFVLTGDSTSGVMDVEPGSTVGPESINIKLRNNDTGDTVTFTAGTVWKPLDKAYTVQGNGTWSSSLRPEE